MRVAILFIFLASCVGTRRLSSDKQLDRLYKRVDQLEDRAVGLLTDASQIKIDISKLRDYLKSEAEDEEELDESR